jgi:hypothetical protein
MNDVIILCRNPIGWFVCREKTFQTNFKLEWSTANGMVAINDDASSKLECDWL